MRSRKVDAGGCGNAHLDPVGKHLGAAGHRRAVAAGFADDRRGFAGDRRLVDRGDAFDHLAVGRDDFAGLDRHEIADLEAGGRHDLVARLAVGREQLGGGFRSRAAQFIGLRLAAAFRDCLREIGEEHREPQPDDDVQGEAMFDAAAKDDVLDEEDGRQGRNDGNHEDHRVFCQRARIELAEGRADRRNEDVGVHDAGGFDFAH